MLTINMKKKTTKNLLKKKTPTFCDFFFLIGVAEVNLESC